MIDGSGKRKRQLAIELRCKNPWKLYSKLIEEILHFSGIIYFTSVYFYLFCSFSSSMRATWVAML